MNVRCDGLEVVKRVDYLLRTIVRKASRACVRACSPLRSLALPFRPSVAAHLVRPMLALVHAGAAVREASVRSCARLLYLACRRGRATFRYIRCACLSPGWRACVRAALAVLRREMEAGETPSPPGSRRLSSLTHPHIRTHSPMGPYPCTSSTQSYLLLP